MNKTGIDTKLNVDLVGFKQTLFNFIVPLVCLVVVFLLGFLVILPTIKYLPEKRLEVESKTALATQLKDKRAKLNVLVDFQTVVTENADLINKVLVSEVAVPELLDQISQIAQEAGLGVTRLSYSLSSADTVSDEEVLYKVVSVSLGAEGTYEQLKVFLTNVENAARLINVETFRYNQDSVNEESLLSVSFSLESPYLFVQSDAVTDDPVVLDIMDPSFVETMNKIKTLRFYSSTLLTPVPEPEPEIVEEVLEKLPPIEEELPL